uniref:SZT2 subunit of KICSTOR complex n=1 Tax=Gopherus evgoodei TaxID=1825980 RepID=A0A8C5EXF9_9SAUR
MVTCSPLLQVEDAGQVFLLMKKDYRISRNVRLAWFLNHLHQAIWAVPESELVKSDNELDVLSILPNGWQPHESVRPRPYLLVPSTQVTFLARQYRFVIELDLSPSTGIVDDSTGEIIFDEVFHALSRCLVGLLKPFRIPGSEITYQPEIFVTIQAYSSIIGLQSHQVLFQGCQLDETKRETFLQQIYTQLCAFENKVAEMLQQQYEPKPQVRQAKELSGRKPGISMVTADIGLVSMIRQGILALQLLPSNSSAGIIIITDGVTSVPDVAVCETLLNQLRSSTVACSFVQVGGVYSYDCSFGHVPNVELMKFIAMATFGAYLSTCLELDPLSLDLNVYHKAFLLYSFLRTGESLNPDYYCVSQHRLFNEHLVSASSNPALAMRRKKHTEKEVHADLVSIVSVRLREGYSIREVNITKGGSQLEVKLVLLWKHNMRIEYLAVAAWPLDPSKRSTWVEVTMEGSYDILHDISCTMRKPITSLYRTTVIRRFWNTLQSINQTDQMLVHLQSFDTVPEHFTIPESTKNGVPLFYIPPGSTTPVLSLQHSGSDCSHSQFASYWKPILSMDANFWQRWLHMHRIVLMLEHDTPVPKHLHTPGNNGRYSTIQCRISHSALTSLLRDWSSFVLVEGYSYVKLMPSSEDPAPSSFYVVRIISKAPCMVLRLGFPIGTPAQARNQIVEELQDRILQLRFPHRVQSKEATPKVKRKTFGSSSPSKSQPVAGAPPALSDRPCLVVLHKPLEKLLIRYEKLPSDYRAPFILTLEHPPVSGPLTMVANRTASSTLASLSRYFYHQRWIWCIQSGLAPAVPIAAVAHLLSTLTEVRLSEGFHFASSGDGIINMVLELPIRVSPVPTTPKKHTCIVQYVLFPPHSTSTKDSFSTDDDNDTEVEAIEMDTELNLVTECWVEPQSGHIHSTAENWRYLQGLPYQKIPKALYPRDLACISTMLTFEYISQLCQNKEWVAPALEAKAAEDPNPLDPDMGAGSNVHEIPFQFSLLKLLPKCQQIEMFFLMLTGGPLGPSYYNFFHGCLQHDLSDREIPLADSDHMAFMEQVLQRDRDGHLPPFTLPVIRGKGSATRDMSGSTSTLQVPPLTDVSPANAAGLLLQWRCYAKLVSPQHLFLTFLPATFPDVQKLMACALEEAAKEDGSAGESLDPVCGDSPSGCLSSAEAGQDPGEPGTSLRKDIHISFNCQASQPELSEGHRLRCPIYIYSCSLELLREQMVSPRAHRPPRDIFFRSQFLERPPNATWLDHKHKELVSYCTLLQEHSHQCYVKGLFKSLQQSHSISSQDLLTAVDYCEELLQEIDITHFLLTLCSHVRAFRESHRHFHTHPRAASQEQEEELPSRERGILISESRGFSSCSGLGPEGVSLTFTISCLSRQEKFLEIGSLHFKPVLSNPHYFFYCPPCAKKEEEASRDQADRKGSEDMEGSEAELAAEEGTVSGCCIATESDPELEVEYREKLESEFPDLGSLSDSNTVNHDDDSFSVLGGDSLNEQELLEQEMPPLFVHLTCSVKLRSQHSSMPVRSLPTCLGEVLSCLESCQAMASIDLSDLCVTLDIFVLTLPLEIEGVNADLHHNRWVWGWAGYPSPTDRVPGWPGSPELTPPDKEGGIPPSLSNLPGVHRQAVEATMNEIRWLLDDEMVSALRHSQAISASILERVATHVYSSQGRPSCHSEVVPLQFVFGPEHSLEKFREEFRRMTLPGYVLNVEGSDYHYVSVSRLHPLETPASAVPSLQQPAPGGSTGAAQSHVGQERSSGADAEGLQPNHPQVSCPILQSLGAWGLCAATSALLSAPSSPAGASKQRPSRVQSLVSSQGSMDSDHLGYDGGSSDSECEEALMSDHDPKCPLMPDFWLIVKIQQDRVEVAMAEAGKEPAGECLHLHQTVVRKIGEICRVVNQRLLLQDLHDSHVCNTLLVAESEEDIWKSETPYSSYRQRAQPTDDFSTEESYLAATMQFMPGHFACPVVWSTLIHVHSRLKMGPNMGVSRAIQALRSVLNAFCVVNRKNMFVYQERSTKSVFYLRLSETTHSGKAWEGESIQGCVCRSLALTRSQEPIYMEDQTGSRSSLDTASCRSADSARPVGQVDRHIQLMVHGVAPAGPEITDELVKVLRRRLDEATLDIITVMLVRNCKLTPADVEFIQPPGSLPTEVLQFTLPPASLPWLHAVACYLRQNLLIFLHTPKYTDSNVEHHFKHYFQQGGSPDLDLYLYNKPGGQGTGGKGIACIALSFVDEHGSPLSLAHWERSSSLKLPPSLPGTDLLQDADFESLTAVSRHHRTSCSSGSACTLVRLDVWEKGNISPLQLSEKLRSAVRHALCDAVMEFRVLPAPLCMEAACPLEELGSGGKLWGRIAAICSGEPVTPTNKMGRRSFWDMLSKADSSELGSPKTTDDIVLERPEESRTRRRHKTESVKQHLSQERASATAELEQAQRRQVCQLQEGEVGTMHPLFSQTCQQWMAFMSRLGCPSVQQCSVEIVSRFLLSSILEEVVSLVTALASDTTVKVFQHCPQGATFLPYNPHQSSSPRPAAIRHFILLGRNFHQWRYKTEQGKCGARCRHSVGLGGGPQNACIWERAGAQAETSCLMLYTYNWSPDLGSSLNSSLTRLLQWQNARSHIVHCLLSQKLGLFHHYCHLDTPWHEDSKQPNPFLNSTLEVDALIRSSSPPPSKEQGRLSSSARSLPSLHFPPDMMPFDEALRDVTTLKGVPLIPELGPRDPVSWHGAQFLEIKSLERRELEKQMKIENLFVTWQQRSAQSNMPISLADLETLKQSSRLVHYCATPLLFDPVLTYPSSLVFQKRHRSSDSTASGRDRSHSCDSAEVLPCKLKQEPWLQEMCNAFLQQYIQYLQSMGFILVQVRPPSPARSTSRMRALAFLGTEGRGSFSYKPKADGSPKSTSPPVTTYHLQRALPGGIVLMELGFQGCYFCVKQYALECSRIPMGQSVNSQLSMLFTEECDKVRDLMHVHSFSYDFHLRIVHQYLLGSHMALRQGYHLTSFLEDFIAHHPDIPKFGRNHVFQGMLAMPTNMITVHQLYNYVADHANTYHMKPLRMARLAVGSDGRKGTPGMEQNEYALVSIWNSSGSYKDSEGLRHHDDFDVSLLVCHSAAPFEEQSEAERHVLRLRFYVIMTSQRELFPRLTADMRRFKKQPRLQRESTLEPVVGRAVKLGPGLFYTLPLFPLLASEVAVAQKQLSSMVQLAKCHCRRDNLWKRLFLLEPLASDKLKLGKLSLGELEELLNAVHGKSIADIDPQLGCFLTMTVPWYQSLIKVLLSRFPQSCRHFHNVETGTQYLVVLNQKFTDCFVLVFLDSHSGKTSLTVVFREPFPVQPQNSESPLPQLVSTYHHLESVINTACFNLWTGLL